MQRNSRFDEKAVKKYEYAVLLGMLALLIAFTASASAIINFRSAGEAVNFFLSFVTSSLTVLLFFFCINSYALGRREKQIFECMTTIFFLTALTLLLAGGSSEKPEMSWLTMLLNTLLYLFSSIYWLAFWLFQKGKYRHRFGNRLCGIIYGVFFGAYAAVTLINHFTGFCFTVDAAGRFVVRSYLLFGLTLLWFVIYLVIALTTKCNIKTRLTFSSYSLFPMLNWVFVLIFPDTDFYLNIFSSVGMFLYLIPLYLLFFNVYLESGRLFLEREKELEESRANAMMLKISPHFIANTLSSVVALCYTDAPKAGELASKFAGYLHDNYADMSNEPIIPFSAELEHIRNYLAIEEIRFPGLRVKYDIQTVAFRLPTLTVQPLVENAVRHGISKLPDASGTVTIQSFENESRYVIRILDDGVGFRSADNNEKKHIGIANARTRLALLCGGTLTVAALPKCGTVCEIQIPKEDVQ